MSEKTFTHNDLKVGMTVMLATDWGHGPVIQAKITSLDHTPNTNYETISYTKDNGKSHWAYVEQIRSII